ncbi:MAG: sulfite exporter TauE/SafE family protein [Gammaproteobacteria bacterium]|nr:sulfite exporter TauE/SafE family protein [Gammaproteobacteria bacterium]
MRELRVGMRHRHVQRQSHELGGRGDGVASFDPEFLADGKVCGSSSAPRRRRAERPAAWHDFADEVGARRAADRIEIIGMVSSMMGIGGGTLSVPAMTLTGGAIHQAVGTAAFFGLLLSVPGTIGYLLASPGVALPGATVGLVSLLVLALVAPMSMLTAPVGARLAHALDKRTLSKIFGGFLSLVALRMLLRTFA